MGQSGAHSKKPRVVRGSERLTTRLSELAGLVLAEQEGFEPSNGETPLPDFESGAFDHSATAPQHVEPTSLADSAAPAAADGPQGLRGAATAALRGATVSVSCPPPTIVPSASSTVAVRSCLVKTSRLFLLRTADTSVQPWAVQVSWK